MKKIFLLAVTGIVLLVAACDDSSSGEKNEETKLAVIPTLAVRVFAPATGDAPDTEATGSAASGNNFTVSNVSWSPNHEEFEMDKEYTVSITLAAKDGYTFKGLQMAAINSYIVNPAKNSGGTVTLSYTFHKTEKKVTDMWVKTPPKLSYMVGEKLDIYDLEVTLKYLDGTTLDVPYANFEAHNIETIPEHKTVLSWVVHNGMEIKVLYGRRVDETEPLNVDKFSGAALTAVPAASSAAASSITVNTITASASQTVEYAVSTTNNADPKTLTWQNGTVLGGTTTGTTFYVYARSKENDNYHAGAPRVSAAIKYWSVAFNSSGGSSVPTQYLFDGRTATKPANPTRTAWGANTTRFRGWFTGNTDTIFRGASYNFGTAITANRTLYADWGYRVGDTGPGGGKVFYRSNESFIQYTTATDTTLTLCYYLEAAPVDAGTYAWATSGYKSTNISGTERYIGSGRRNTMCILAKDAGAPAAFACRMLMRGGFMDWFLPSKNELTELSNYLKDIDFLLFGEYYWSSTQRSNYSAEGEFFNSKGSSVIVNKTEKHSVRAIRAF
jgi:hypothetical protein